jgi:NADPH:quinone reductase-like Zn-dependent oxidoreductase
VILDVVGTDLGAYQARLTRGGRMVALAFDQDRVLTSMASMGLRAALSPRRMKLFSNNPSPARIAELAAAAESGTIRPMIDTVYSIDDIAKAHERLEAGGIRGKFIIDMRL